MLKDDNCTYPVGQAVKLLNINWAFFLCPYIRNIGGRLYVDISGSSGYYHLSAAYMAAAFLFAYFIFKC